MELKVGQGVTIEWVDSVMERSWQSLGTLQEKLPVYLPTITTMGYYVAHDKHTLIVASSLSHSELLPEDPHFAGIVGIPRVVISRATDAITHKDILSSLWKK